jgi:hypothetical protein
LETGAGLSTVVFAINRTDHICIVPDGSQVARIREYCSDKGIPTDRVHFIVDQSQNVLPASKLRDIDVALIDGSHSFPVTFLDFYYVALGLKVGGLLVVDDTNLWTGKAIKQFLSTEPEWKIKAEFPRSVAFEKIAQANLDKDWVHQRFTTRMSRVPRALARLRTGVFLLRRGEWRAVLGKVVNLIGLRTCRGKHGSRIWTTVGTRRRSYQGSECRR